MAYALDASDDGGIGEIVVMIAFQAEIVWRRTYPLVARTSTRGNDSAHTDTAGRSPQP